MALTKQPNNASNKHKQYISCKSTSQFPYKGSVFIHTTDSANHGQTRKQRIYRKRGGRLSLPPSVYHHIQQSVIVSETETWGWASLRTARQLSLEHPVQSEKEAETQINRQAFISPLWRPRLQRTPGSDEFTSQKQTG